MADRDGTLLLFAAIAAGIAAPAVYFVHILAATWTGYHTAIVLAIGGACAWRFAGVFGVGAEHALRNRRVRDVARTTTMIEAQARPALPDAHREASLIQAQAAASASLGRAAAVWERLETGAHVAPTAAVERAWPPVNVWDQPRDQPKGDGGWDDDA